MAGKAEIVESIANRVDGISKKQAAEAFDAVFESIRDNLGEGARISLPGFGTFSVSSRAVRQGRNPATGQPITIPAQNSVRFKVAKDLKTAVNT